MSIEISVRCDGEGCYSALIIQEYKSLELSIINNGWKRHDSHGLVYYCPACERRYNES